jgi:type II secretory pathway pseudopilin PulG
MSFEVKCPWCRAPVEMDGDEKICPKCGHLVTLARAVEMDPLPPPPSKEEARFPPERETLLLVIAAILVVMSAGIMVVRLWSTPRRFTGANETVAIATLRVIQNAQELYSTRFKEYAASFQELSNAKLLDPRLARTIAPGQVKSGYCFAMTRRSRGWEVTAIPAEPGESGSRTALMVHMPRNCRISPANTLDIPD